MGILKALIEEGSENYGNTDDSDGTFANFIENCLEDYAECARESNKIKEMINYYFYWYVEKNDYGLFDNNITIAIDNAGEEYYDFIEEKIKNAKEFADYDLLYLYDKKGATDKYIQLCKDKISDISFRIKLCEKLREIGNLEESIKYCVEGYNNSNYKFEFANLLAEMYEEQGKYENALHYWNSAFLYHSWDLDLYEKVKELSFKIGNWNAIKNNIIETLEHNGKYSALLEIYLREGEIDNAISLASSEKVYIDDSETALTSTKIATANMPIDIKQYLSAVRIAQVMNHSHVLQNTSEKNVHIDYPILSRPFPPIYQIHRYWGTLLPDLAPTYPVLPGTSSLRHLQFYEHLL
ncbi:MAG TPA: hypothetical protein EYP22_00005, partial [Methanosarcinales archaeon]|nr:hypothetical protein [Methanosarcinales archaeon]